MIPTRQAAKREMQDIVRQALDTLNDRQRMAVLLHKFEGMSYADIGQAMEMSVPAVKSLLSRAGEPARSPPTARSLEPAKISVPRNLRLEIDNRIRNTGMEHLLQFMRPRAILVWQTS